MPALLERPEPGPEGQRLDCSGRNHCLGKVADLGWDGWGCEPACRLYLKMSVEETRLEIEGMADMFYAISKRHRLDREAGLDGC